MPGEEPIEEGVGLVVEVPLRCGGCNAMVSPSAGTCPRCGDTITGVDRMRRRARSIVATLGVAAFVVGLSVFWRYQVRGPNIDEDAAEMTAIIEMRAYIDAACACTSAACASRALEPVPRWAEKRRATVVSDEGKAAVAKLKQRGLDCLMALAPAER